MYMYIYIYILSTVYHSIPSLKGACITLTSIPIRSLPLASSPSSIAPLAPFPFRPGDEFFVVPIENLNQPYMSRCHGMIPMAYDSVNSSIFFPDLH